MSINRIFGLAPINRTAGVVTSQRGVSQSDEPLVKDELLALYKLMERKSRLLKLVLKITNKSQHKNAVTRYNQGIKSNFRDSRALAEYVRLGLQMQVFLRLVAEMNAANEAKDKPALAERRRLAEAKAAAINAEGVEKALRTDVMRRDGYQCMKCRMASSELIVAHITPLSEGGATVAANLQTVCLSCNSIKGAKE